MNLNDKLKGIPNIYYLNLDDAVDRKIYMESQFDYWKITNYYRVSTTKFSVSNIDEWKSSISNEKNYILNYRYTSIFINHINMIKNWLETTNDSYMIMMEDDYDLSLINYWNFDWEYLMKNLPYDWDCIQLGFESFSHINFFLHPKLPDTYFGCCLINRNYAEKLLRLYYKNGKYIVDYEINNIKHLFDTEWAKGTLDYSICENGKVYCIPLIPQNPQYTPKATDNKNEYFSYIHNLYSNWWKYEHHNFPVEDFFTYNKPTDFLMTKKIPWYIVPKNKIFSKKITYS